MRKIGAILLGIWMVLSFSACSGSIKNEENQTTLGSEPQSTMASSEVMTSQPVTSQSTQSQEATTEEESKGAEQFKNLKDKALLEAINDQITYPKSYYMIYEIADGNHRLKGGACKNGEDYKFYDWNEADGGWTYMLYSSEKNVNYYYRDDMDEGYYVKAENPDKIRDIDNHFMKFDFLMEQISLLEEAKIDTLDGEECLYMKFKDESEGIIGEAWYSLEKSFLIKLTETDLAGQLISEFKALELVVNEDFSQELKLPENIKFTDQGSTGYDQPQ